MRLYNIRPSIFHGCGYPEAQARGCTHNQGGYYIGMYYTLNLASADWSRAKTPGKGAVAITESVATDNVSQPIQKTRGDADYLLRTGCIAGACNRYTEWE